MKKTLFLIIIFNLICCSEKNGECYSGPLYYEIKIAKDNPRIKELVFNTEDKLDIDKVYFYKVLGGKEVKVYFRSEVPKYNIEINGAIFSFGDPKENLFTDNLETIYFKTPTRVDTLRIKGKVVKGECNSEHIENMYFSVNGKETASYIE